jgi:hypothetical protein
MERTSTSAGGSTESAMRNVAHRTAGQTDPSHSSLDTSRLSSYNSLMLRRSFFLAVLAASAQAWAQEAAAPAPLTKEEITGAAAGEQISLPMPSELFSALGKRGKPDWSALLRKAPSAKFANRQQIALNLGGLIADGYLAVEAQDAGQVRTVARDINGLATSLGVQQKLVNRGNKIIEFAEAGNWDALMEELEAVQNEVIDEMKAQEDENFVTLVLLGGWLRGTEVVTSYLTKNYSAEGARVLRQPAVVNYFVKKLAEMPKRILDTPLMNEVRVSLFAIHKAVAFNQDTTPSEEDVKKLNELAIAVVKKISTTNK